MKYFLDTEFTEGPQKEKFPISLFRKNTPPTIDLISIGIVSEDGREYYAISKDFNLKEAWNRYDLEEQSGDMRNVFPEGKKVYWIRENVLKSIWRELLKIYELTNDVYSNKQADIFIQNVDAGYFDKCFSFKSLKSLFKLYGKTNKQIAEEIKKFCFDEVLIAKYEGRLVGYMDNVRGNPEFYAYYADYDWVVFCWLFGKMMDLPKGFPMYCKDLKQLFDQKEDWLRIPTAMQHMDLKQHTHYPKQENEHSAIDDARWNKKLYDFLKSI